MGPPTPTPVQPVPKLVQEPVQPVPKLVQEPEPVVKVEQLISNPVEKKEDNNSLESNISTELNELKLTSQNSEDKPQEDKLLFVSVGRISPEKNFEFLMKIIEKFSNIFLCIVGDGPYREEIKKLFPKDRTNFIGFLEGEELASAYASADYFIYASVSETFGQVYLEAMSSGIPVVAAEGKQMREFFINSQHGYTWRPGDENSAYEAIKNAMENHERISKNCRSNALKHSWNSSADQIINLYSQFVNHKSNRNVFTMTFRSIYYFMKWLFLMFLCLFFMAPFLTRKSIASNASRSPIDLNKFLFFHNFITKKVYTESNRVCRTFLATLSAVCLSLIFTSIYVMCNGKMSVNYFITFLN